VKQRHHHVTFTDDNVMIAGQFVETVDKKAGDVAARFLPFETDTRLTADRR
jgi:hypothetical protein